MQDAWQNFCFISTSESKMSVEIFKLNTVTNSNIRDFAEVPYDTIHKFIGVKMDDLNSWPFFSNFIRDLVNQRKLFGLSYTIPQSNKTFDYLVVGASICEEDANDMLLAVTKKHKTKGFEVKALELSCDMDLMAIFILIVHKNLKKDINLFPNFGMTI